MKAIIVTLAIVIGANAQAAAVYCSGYIKGEILEVIVKPNSAIEIFKSEELFGSVQNSERFMKDQGLRTVILGGSRATSIALSFPSEGNGVAEVTYVDNGVLRLKTDVTCTDLNP